MTRRHSLVTRALALVLALVLIASNGAGLTLGAKAAVTGNLFDLMSANGASNAKLDAVLAYADYMLELKAMNIAVEYEAAPTAAVGTLRQGTLTVNKIGDWFPVAAILPDGSTLTIPSNGVIEGLDEEIASANVVYQNDLGVQKQVADIHTWISDLASVAARQAAALDTLSTGKKLSALKLLEGEFIYALGSDVDAVKAENLNITAAELGISEDPADYGFTEEQLEHPEAQEQFKQALAEAVKAEIDKNLPAVKADFQETINNLLARMVGENEKPYCDYPDYKGNPGVYVDYLRIYAMMDQYDKQGLPFYYERANDVATEMETMVVALSDMLGENSDNSIYYEKAMTYLMEEGDYGVTIDQIRNLKKDMEEGVTTLRELEKSTVLQDKVNVAECPDMKGLCDALAACGTVSNVAPTVVLRSGQLSILDDSWKYIQTSVNGIPVNVKYATDTVLTAEDIAKAIAQIEAAAPHYNLDCTAVSALIGTKMTANVDVGECAAEPKTYTVQIENGESLNVFGDAAELALPYKKGHEITYRVNGTDVVVKNADTAVITLDAAAMNAIAKNEFSIVMVKDEDVGKTKWETLVDVLNGKMGAGSFMLTDDTLTANITLGQLGEFGQIVFDQDIESILLNGAPFLSKLDNSYIISVQTLIDALLCDATFTNEKVIALGNNGSGNLLNSTIEIFDSERAFVLNLTSVPAQMKTVATGLNAVKDYFWFQSSGPIQGRSVDSVVAPYLNVSLNLPEKVYEAYLTAAVLSGRITKQEASKVKNQVALEFMASYMELLVSSDADVSTLENTLASLGAAKDLSKYKGYYNLLKKVATSEGFSYTISEEAVDFYQTGNGEALKALLDAMGLDYTEISKGQDVIDDDEQIHATAVVTLVNEVPQFEALIIDPARLNDTGAKAKLLAANYVTDLPTASIQGPAAIMLLGDVDGNLVFDTTTILDLNGFKVNGNIVANSRLFIVDSSMDTVSGAGVTGSVTGNVNVLAGNYPNANVEGFLRDGYYMDGKNVMNAMYQIKDGKIIVDGDLYIKEVNGYLPAAHYMAADLAIDMALNYYFHAGFDADGNGIYAIKFENLVKLLETKDVGDLADQTLACFNAAGTSAFINTVIADLLDFGAISNAIENNTTLAKYTFTVYPWSVATYHEKTENYVTMDILPASEGKTYTLDLAVAVPESNAKDKLVKALKVLDKRVVESKVEVTIDQPERDGKNLVVGGSGTAAFTLDFSDDQKYNEMLAGVIAYFNEDVESVLVDEKMCIIALNNAMSKVTVGQFFTAVEGVIENKDLNFEAIANKLEVELTEAELAKLEELYADFETVCLKVLNKFDLTTNATAPLSELADGNGAFVLNGDIQAHSGDVYVKGFGLIANLGYSDVTLTVQLAPKCTEIWGDANWDGKVTVKDVVALKQYIAGLRAEDEIHLCVCDLNGDGKYTVKDVVALKQFIAGLITKLPVEK